MYINMYCMYYIYFLGILLLHFFSPTFSAGSHPKGWMETCPKGGWKLPNGHLNPCGLETSLRMLCTILLLKAFSAIAHGFFVQKSHFDSPTFSVIIHSFIGGSDAKSCEVRCNSVSCLHPQPLVGRLIFDLTTFWQAGWIHQFIWV